MAQVKLLRGLKEKLHEIPIIEGQMLFTIDDGTIYLDIAGTEDIPGSQSSRIELYKITLQKLFDEKQDNLIFNTPYNQETNKVATMSDIQEALATLAKAMNYIGISISDPTAEDGPTIMGYTEDFKPGDVCLYDKKEFIYDGNIWREFGNEGDYAVKGAITNFDIAEDAAIDPSKIAGLPNLIEHLTWGTLSGDN